MRVLSPLFPHYVLLAEVVMPSKSDRGLSPSKSRSTGFKGAKASSSRSRPASTKSTKPPRLPGEKAVRATNKTVGVKPAKASRATRTPLDPNAIDRRKQIVD